MDLLELWFIWLCTTLILFLTIYDSPYSSWKFQIFLYTSLLTFIQIIETSLSKPHTSELAVHLKEITI